METRSCPARDELEAIACEVAEHVSAERIRRLSKIELYSLCRRSCDFERFRRRRMRTARSMMDPAAVTVHGTPSAVIANSNPWSVENGEDAFAFQFPSDGLPAAQRCRADTIICGASKKRDRETKERLEGSLAKKQKQKQAQQQAEEEMRLDPVLLCPLTEDTSRHFYFRRPNGTDVVYDVVSLVDYLLASGDFRDPESRLPFSDTDLARLDELAQRKQLGKASVVEAKGDSAKWDALKFKRDAILGLERCIGEVLVGMSRVIESHDRLLAESALLLQLFPEYEDLFRQMWDADAAAATMNADDHVAFLKGPPNNRALDPHGLLGVCVNFIRCTSSCQGNTTAPSTMSLPHREVEEEEEEEEEQEDYDGDVGAN